MENDRAFAKFCFWPHTAHLASGLQYASHTEYYVACATI